MNQILRKNQDGEVEIFIGTYGDKWVAATGCAPYFCIEAESSAALDKKLDRLVAFAKRAVAHVRGTSEGERDESKTFTLKKKIVLKELEFA